MPAGFRRHLPGKTLRNAFAQLYFTTKCNSKKNRIETGYQNYVDQFRLPYTLMPSPTD